MKPTLIKSCLLLIPASVAIALEPASDARLDEVARKGRHVMPFNLERTLHIFSKTEQGGVQQVIANDQNDQRQITLIRQHLKEIAEQFSRRDFSSPQRIHGADMPGLSMLKNAEPDAISITYRDLQNGAELTYKTPQPKLVDALHLWFDAQLRDHRRHATGHHNMHHQ